MLEPVAVDPSLVQPGDAQAKVNFYGVAVVNKISSKGKAQQRTLLLTAAMLLQVEAKGKVKRVVTNEEIVQITRDRSRKLWRVEVSGDRDWLFAETPDPRNNPKTMEEFMQRVDEARRATRTADALKVQEGTLGFQMCDLKRRQHTTVRGKMERYERSKPDARKVEERKVDAEMERNATDYEITLEGEDELWGLELQKAIGGRAKIASCIAAAERCDIPCGILCKINGKPVYYEGAAAMVAEKKKDRKMVLGIHADKAAITAVDLTKKKKESDELIEKQAKEIEELKALLRTTEEEIKTKEELIAMQEEQLAQRSDSSRSSQCGNIEELIEFIDDEPRDVKLSDTTDGISNEDSRSSMEKTIILQQVMPMDVAEKLLGSVYTPRKLSERGGVRAALERVRNQPPSGSDTAKINDLQQQLTDERRLNKMLSTEVTHLRDLAPVGIIDPRRRNKDFSATLSSWYSGSLGATTTASANSYSHYPDKRGKPLPSLQGTVHLEV
eukprot:TRINITY_DN21327_c0_g1_i1.p1 TRINITY_DN21327_c0_g1~~TRINITY_DN21327_c0_g1_i1.p1  ORF type:complete len:499 (+),score=156.62 TRINITY_DN21327_c0_g1_i1:33-1529(+)